MITTSAPGKVILFGEHAVVYGRPALAVPLPDIRAYAEVEHAPPGSGLTIESLDLKLSFTLAEAARRGLAQMAAITLEWLDESEPDAVVRISSRIPVAGGLGSGAAVSAAVGRALAAYFDRTVPPAELSALVYEVEKTYHGTPSGIDNTVVCYEKPVFFVKGQIPQLFSIDQPFLLLVGDTGMPGLTRETVGQVRVGWQADPEPYETLFDRIGRISKQARQAIEDGAVDALGPLMDENQRSLELLGVSSPELNRLIKGAREAGALGAKLSGGGGGGNMIALVSKSRQMTVRDALLQAGASQVLTTEIR